MMSNRKNNRHPELGSPSVTYVPGSIVPRTLMVLAARWMLNPVQHDDDLELSE